MQISRANPAISIWSLWLRHKPHQQPLAFATGSLSGFSLFALRDRVHGDWKFPTYPVHFISAAGSIKTKNGPNSACRFVLRHEFKMNTLYSNKHLNEGVCMPKRDMCQIECVDMSKVERIRPLLDQTEPMLIVFKALADANRLRVALALAVEEMCVCEVAVLLDTSVQNASHHLRVLKNTGLATYRREGKLVFYKLKDNEIVFSSVQKLLGGEMVDSASYTG